MNELALVQKVWNYAHVLRDQSVPYQAYISQISSHPPPRGREVSD
jgi:type I restriction enzyme M protein